MDIYPNPHWWDGGGKEKEGRERERERERKERTDGVRVSTGGGRTRVFRTWCKLGNFSAEGDVLRLAATR